MQRTESFTLYIDSAVAQAIDLRDTRGRARATGIEDFAAEVGHGKFARRSIWHVHCGRAVAEMLIKDIDGASQQSESASFRQSCAIAIATIRAELAAPQQRLTSYIQPVRQAGGSKILGG
jgi:hypothetical protein